MPTFRLRAFALAVFVAALALSVPASATQDDAFPVQLVRVNVPTQADRDRLVNLGLDLTEHGGPTFVEAVLHRPSDAELLLTEGFTWTVTIPDLALREIENNEVNAAYAASTDVSPLPSGRDAYRTLADYENELSALAADNPDIVRHFTLSRTSLEDGKSSASRSPTTSPPRRTGSPRS
jgi:hypothetical protein